MQREQNSLRERKVQLGLGFLSQLRYWNLLVFASCRYPSVLGWILGNVRKSTGRSRGLFGE